MESENAQLVLESLSVGIPALTPVKSAFLKEACVWCLLQCDHPNGVLISCEICNDNVGYSIKWNDDFDLETLLRSYNMDDAVEFGAEALSLLLVREKTNYTAIKRAVRPSGIDYWLGYKKEKDISLFSFADARLEISGILKESSTNTIKAE